MKAIFTGLVAVPLAIALMVLFIEHTAFEAPESQTRSASVVQIAWSADGRRMLARCRHNESTIGTSSGPLALFDLAGDGAALLLDDLQISSAVLAPDGVHVLAGGEDGRLLRVEIASAARVTLAEIPQ